MARLPKPYLFHLVEEAIRDSGWSFLHLSPIAEHPASYHVYKDGEAHRVRIYIWNVTPGGGPRAADEFRIQITGIQGATGVQQFMPEIGGKTLILGWWGAAGVFASFDYTHHTAPLGSSPSIQIGEVALLAARTQGFAPHNKGNGELAIAFRPDFLGTYIQNLESLHQCGQSTDEIKVLEEIGANPDDVEDDEIEQEVAASRQYAVVSTKRALREMDFRDRVLGAYEHRCAMCGVQLKLLDAAHILPVKHPASTDETRNGVSLCTLHHRAYDRALVAFDPKFKVHLNDDMAEDLTKIGHGGQREAFAKGLLPSLLLPTKASDQPAAAFVETANDLRGWAL